MKNLLTITALILFFSISSPSFGLDKMSLYTETPLRVEIASEVNIDHVEEDYMDFYIDTIHPQLNETSLEPTLLAYSADQQDYEGDFINIFGVRVPTNSKSGTT